MKLLFPSHSRKTTASGSQSLFCFVVSLLVAWSVCGSFVSTQAQKVDAAASELKRGKLLYDKHDLAGAITSYSKAIELRPDWALAYVRRCYVRWLQGDVDQAVADYDRAMELDPASIRDDRSITEAYISHGSTRKN